jgi:glycerol-3-phosphate O-acyltransferase
MVENPPPQPAAPPAPRLPDPEVGAPPAAPVARGNHHVRGVARRFFSHFDVDDATAARLRALEDRGAVVYVMRYASRLDYFLFNTLFAQKGMRLAAFANGLSFYYYQPLLGGLKNWLKRRRLRGRARQEADRERAKEKVGEVVRAGESMFLFLRTARYPGFFRGREAAVAESRRELDLLAEIVHAADEEGREVHLVPLALFWRKGPRNQRRFLKLSYGSSHRPSDFAKVTSFLLTYRDLAIKVGDPIDLASFIEKRRDEGEPKIVRMVRRSILLFLFREERVVEGPVLRPRHKVQDAVLSNPVVAAAIAARGREPKQTPEAARAQAEKMFREVAANMNPSFLAILSVTVEWIFGRLFASIETRGLEKVADYAKRHPVVLVPSHRSYFDFLILSWLFYQNHLVPPHIAARDNMGFGPFGFVFRRAGAFFLRKSFDSDLYKAVFRAYVGHLVREGFTQEFFIEGGRSRTGKSLVPRLGMLSWNVQGFVDSGRRDLFLVPVGITYERLVEEGAMVDELEGGKKTKESMLGLVRARKVLGRRYGTVFINFGEPISLARELEGKRHLFTGAEDEAKTAAKRAFTEGLGNEIVERINGAMVANATSVAASALLGEGRRGYFRGDLAIRMGQLIELLQLQDVPLTPELLADAPDFQDSIDFLLRSGLLKTKADPRGEILYFEDAGLRALDVYRNVILHYLAVPSWISRGLLAGLDRESLRADLKFWLELFYEEVFAPTGIVQAAHFDAFLDDFQRRGLIVPIGERLTPSPEGHAFFHVLAEQTRGLLETYLVAVTTVAEMAEPTTLKALEKEGAAQFERGGLLGEVRRPESWNSATFRNAIELLGRRGILEPAEPEGRDKRVAPGAAFGDLEALRERLATALAYG